MIDTAFGQARDGRDIVLFDPRGMGRSTRFACAIDAIPRAFDATEVARMGARCAPQAGAIGLDAALTTIARDIDAVRAALGVPQFDIWGGSYGTKYAQAYARLYPSRVGRMVLDGTLPVDRSILLYAATDANRAWRRLVQSCATDPACNAAYPDVDEMTMSLLRRAAASPLRQRIANPASGQTEDVVFDRMALSNVIRGALYVPQFAALLPFAIGRAQRGDLSKLAALNAAGAAWSTDNMALDATAAVMCSEEAPPARSARIEPGRLIGNSYAEYWLTLCRDWPESRPPFRLPRERSAAIPALFLVGGLDPIAPLARAREAARSFTNTIIAVALAGGRPSARSDARRISSAGISTALRTSTRHAFACGSPPRRFS